MNALTSISSEPPATSQAASPPLVVAQLAKVYPNAAQPALQELNLTVHSGEIYGLLGPNGAGKTTAISIMSAALLPTDGRVEIYGWDVVRHRNRVKELIGLVPQEIALYPDLTAWENLSFFGKLYGLSGSELSDRIAHALELVGLTGKADQLVKHYSGGMKRRVNLAAGILHTPRLVFLDEPTVGIDAQSRNLILEKLSTLKNSGTTMIYTTHYMEEAQLLCTRTAVIDEGRVIEEGPPEALIRKHPDCDNLGELFLKLTGKKLRD
jgi:ABC-2 type transport system ATP-binding protein